VRNSGRLARRCEEALKVLYAEGLVFLLPNRGLRTAKLATEDLQDLFDGSIKTDVPYAASQRLLTVALNPGLRRP
jgi:hypothetical protein